MEPSLWALLSEFDMELFLSGSFPDPADIFLSFCATESWQVTGDL